MIGGHGDMSDNYRALVGAGRQAAPATTETAEKDDPEESQGYQAVRRIFSFRFDDVEFCRPNGDYRTFPWHYLRTTLGDEAGTRLSLVWPETTVSLVGRHLDRYKMDIKRRIISVFRQIPLGQADSLPEGTPVIMAMSFEPTGRPDSE